MWKCIFDSTTNRGVAFNRAAGDGEFQVEMQPSECAWFASTPERYQYVDGVFSEYPGWEQEQAEKEAAAELQYQKDAIAKQRYEMETSGLSYEGLTVPTDRESVQILDSTCEKIRRGLVSSIDWKCKDGYLTLTAENIDALEIAILTHVQTAFGWEKLQLEALESPVEE
jgi:hypothetical protein